jgi:hypothetical protein
MSSVGVEEGIGNDGWSVVSEEGWENFWVITGEVDLPGGGLAEQGHKAAGGDVGSCRIAHENAIAFQLTDLGAIGA